MRPGLTASVVTEAALAATQRVSDVIEPRFARAVERELRRLVRDVVAAWERSTKIVHAAAYADVARSPAVDDPDDWVPPRYSVPLSSEMIDDVAANEGIEAISDKYRREAILATGDELAGEIAVQFDQRNRLLDGVIASQSGMKIVTAPSRVVEGMMQSLQKSYDAGDSIPKAARGMRAAGYEGSQKEAVRIARTETVRASNAASLAVVQATTELGFKTWIGGTRPAHVEADGQVVPIDSTFIVGGEQLDYPGDDAGSAWNVINCRCTLGYQDNPGELNTLGDPGTGIEPSAPDAVSTPVDIVEASQDWPKERLEGMFQSRTLTDMGMRVEAYSEDVPGEGTRITATIRGADGVERGHITRNIYEGTVEHEDFTLAEELQGRGIAKEMMRSQLNEYEKAGELARVEVIAAGVNGRYTWARFGFDFAEPNGLVNYRSGFQSRVAQMAGVNWREFAEKMPETAKMISAAEHPWEFAGMMINENGVVLTGKDAMLSGPGWSGEMILGQSSEGRAIFDAYAAP